MKRTYLAFLNYTRLFSLKQDDRAVSDYFALLKGTSDKILLYHPLSCDAQTRKSQWEDFLVAKFLSALDNNLKMVRDHFLANDSVPTLSNALARVLRVATGSSDSSSSSGTTTKSSAMGVRGRGRSSSRGRGSREWANTVTSGGEPTALEPSPNPSESVILSCEEYEQLLHCPVANSATPTTSSSPGAFVASHGKSWMLDSGATTHLTGNRSNFSNVSISHIFPPVRLVDGSYSPISGSGTIHPTNHLTLTNVLFAPEFPVNLLSNSQLTQKHNCSVTFFPSYCVFQDLQTQRTNGGGHERGGLYFLNTSPPIDARALSASVFPL
ncbi:UNVERIFIED_CONTAM: Retrovirus-related Pol polyprotein from transposon RE1 [Sesamum angustifolium]|uniref:Retrovirus-related Pol polyprotein from transposon RE1 n=1 Tax=Sesamum angustifolium TaxID=2727405 RepID=A0AAW2IVJ5_9LAMI